MSYQRRYSTVTHIGNTPLGGNNPIRVQSMTTTDTNDTQACIEQAQRIIDAGGEYVRLTTQGSREAENLKNIVTGLRERGYDTPLVADVHFNANVADVAARYVEKVRINPGNYVDPGRTFKQLEYTDEEYAEELKKIENRLLPFIAICREHHTAVRIGVNHGSLSDRIMSRYGDTPAGIVESCMEFLRIFRKESVRLLVKQMDNEDMHYPLHLGVTEAGEGEDGRIKSAVGIGALLTEGIGDTIRVSLSEEPEAEIPVALTLVGLIEECSALREQLEREITDDTIRLHTNASSWEEFQLKTAMACGALLIDRKATKLEITTDSRFEGHDLVALADGILQAARIKFTKTEYISCPGCGRTLYDLRSTIARIKEATKDMPGLKIGIMGCIVNGPGEMADADFGYVGAGRGKISLYRKKECVLKNIPEEEAVERLLELISQSSEAGS